MTRLVFLGTPEAAIVTLKALDASVEVGLVVTRPDQRRGRSGRPSPPPVAEWAFHAGLPLSQPSTRGDLVEVLQNHGSFDLGVVVAYGQILPAEALAVPAMGMLNVHFSLLPRWRGAAPVARALLAGDATTGVTIIRLDEGLDTGPVLTAQVVDVKQGESAGELTGRLADLGASLLTSVIDPYLRGELTPVTQSDEGATYAGKLTAEDRALDPGQGPDVFVNRVRALSPRPGATLTMDGEPFKVLSAERTADPAPPMGEWARSPDGRLLVAAGEVAIALTSVQPPGRKAMSGTDWLRGARRPGGRLG